MTRSILLRAHRDKAAAHRYFEKSIAENGEPETVTIDKSGATLAALEAINAERETPIKIRQNRYLNNIMGRSSGARGPCWASRIFIVPASCWVASN